MNAFTDLEPNVRSYCRIWPRVFHRAAGSRAYNQRLDILAEAARAGS